MSVKRRIIAVSHCILNKYSKVESSTSKEKDIFKLLLFLMQRDIGIIQLPCPEMHMYGIKRWGHVKDQFNTPFFRETSRSLLKPIIQQIQDYSNNEYNFIGIIGIEGSPSCGAYNTCTSREWGGEFKDIGLIDNKISTIAYTKSRGVLMEELDNMLKGVEISPQFFGLLGDDVESLIGEIDLYLEKNLGK